MFMLARVSILRLAMDPIRHSRHRRKLNGQAKMLSKLKTPFSEPALICGGLALQTVKIGRRDLGASLKVAVQNIRVLLLN